MHPEIEKLIDLIIIDGQISEKERDVIIKKAKELGVDLDEVIITLDAKLYQKEAEIIEVWASNLEEEILKIAHLAENYTVISFDTEFPGTVKMP